MITSSKLRNISAEFIRMITDDKVIQFDDIRWLKDKNGQFPRKFVWSGKPGAPDSTYKETPYSLSDTFVLFDVLEEKNIASERIGSRVISNYPFRIVINIYGNSAPDAVQHLIAALHKYETKYWLQSMKITVTSEPDSIQILDGRENASWWIRRRVEIPMNAEQAIQWFDEVDVEDISEIKLQIKEVGDK